MSKEPTADEIIDAIGGTAATAALCLVKDPSVSEWRRTGIPAARLMFLKLAHPDVFAGITSPHSAIGTAPDQAVVADATTGETA